MATSLTISDDSKVKFAELQDAVFRRFGIGVTKTRLFDYLVEFVGKNEKEFIDAIWEGHL